MVEKLLEGLASQGAMGIVLAILLWLFVRFFNRSFDAQAERDRLTADFMRQCLSTLQEIKAACTSCRNEIMTSENTRVGSLGEKLVLAIQESAKTIISETRRDNDLSRPHSVTPDPVSRQPYPPVSGMRRG